MRVPCLIATLAALPAGLVAQDACREFGRAPAVGAYSDYRLTDKKGEPNVMRFAVVRTEKREGREMRWFEVAFTGTKKGQSSVFQVLAPGYPYEVGEMEEIVMKTEGRPAMKMDGSMMGIVRGSLAKNPGLSVGEMCKQARLVGQESITVPAGTFKTRHYRDDKHAADVWITQNLPFGMVKSVGKDYEMVLTGHGRGAKSRITEVPTEMKGGR
jgi:hypothetical protein